MKEAPGVNVFEDRDLEVASEVRVSVEDQIARIELALARAHRREAVAARGVC
jgi:hypothetical protein